MEKYQSLPYFLRKTSHLTSKQRVYTHILQYWFLIFCKLQPNNDCLIHVLQKSSLHQADYLPLELYWSMVCVD